MNCASLAFGLAGCFFALPSTATTDAHSQGSRFPYTVTLEIDNHFFLYGEEVSGPLIFTYTPGAMWVNGTQVLPRPAPFPPPPLTDGQMLEVWGDVPFVKECMKDGRGVRECSEALYAKKKAMIDAIGRVWRQLRDDLIAVRDSLPKDDSAGQWRAISDSALSAIDPDVVGDTAIARAKMRINEYGNFWLPIPGIGVPLLVDISAPPPPPSPPDSLTEEKAFIELRSFAMFLERPEPGIVIISRGTQTCANGAKAVEVFEEIGRVKADPDLVSHILSRSETLEFRQ